MGQEEPGVRIAKLLRRKYPRFLLTLPLEYFHPDSNFSHPRHAEDATKAGLKVYLTEQFQVGQTLRMKLFFARGSELQTVESTTRPVWAGFPPEEQANQYGMVRKT